MTSPPSPLAGYEEEALDRYFFRPVSHPVAVVCGWMGFTPNGVSVLGFLAGAAGGWFFQYHEARLVLWGVLLFTLRNILDYADGQLARMKNSGTRYGYYFDGLCDYGASMSVYAFGALGIWPEYGPWTILMVVAAGVSGGWQSQLLDFYKHEYKYWALGNDGARYKPPEELRAQRAEARGFDRFLLQLGINYSVQQGRLTKRRRALHAAWAPQRDDPAFQERYSRVARRAMRLWFLVGPNWQAYLFFAFGLLGRMDGFFLVQAVVLNVLVLVANAYQARCDRALQSPVGAQQPVEELTTRR